MSDRPPRPPWSEFKSALDGAGFHPSRRLGQNFLLDENVARAIVADAGVGEGDRVVEVGPGLGFLSVHLAHAGVQLACIEVDTRLAPIAEEFLRPYSNARVILGDALAGKHALGPEMQELIPSTGDWHLVANLPYSISGPVLALVANGLNPPKSLTVLVQSEVTERLAAEGGSAQFGPLSVALQLAFSMRAGRRVPPGAFSPRPKVESRLAHGERRSPLLPYTARIEIRDLAGTLLQRRRQVLRRVLGDHLGDRETAWTHLEQAGLDPGMRVGQVPLSGWEALARAINPSLGAPEGGNLSGD